MEKVIETNLTLKQCCYIGDHQSRVIEVESWDEYLKEVETGKCKTRTSYIGNLSGCTIPKNCKVIDFVADEYHASCTVVMLNGTIKKKLMYRI